MSEELFAVMRAAKTASLEEMEPLLEAGPEGCTGHAAMSAAKNGNIDLLRALIERVDERTLGGCLKGAARLGQAEAAKLVLEAGAPPDGPGKDGGPMRDLCHYGEPEKEQAYVEILGALLEAGADPNLSRGPNWNFTSLHHLAYSGWSAQAAKMLVEAGADLLAGDSRDRVVIDLSYADFKGRDKSAVQAYFDVAFAAASKDM